ncbi:unnamed protein product, partial [Polarella glacialis]
HDIESNMASKPRPKGLLAVLPACSCFRKRTAPQAPAQVAPVSADQVPEEAAAATSAGQLPAAAVPDFTARVFEQFAEPEPDVWRIGFTAGTARTTGTRFYTRDIFIQMVGAQGVGKTCLLGALINEHDPAQESRFEEQKNNLMTHHEIQVGEHALKFLDCSGNERASHLVKEWFGRSEWVFVIYSLTDQKSYEKAIGLMTDARQRNALWRRALWQQFEGRRSQRARS